MMLLRYILSVAVVLLCFSLAFSDPDPSTPPPGSIALTIGDEKITEKQIEDMLGRFPKNLTPAKRETMRKRIMEELILETLVAEYIEANDIQFAEEDLAAVEQQLAEMAQKRKMTPKEFRAQMGVTQKDLEAQARSLHLLRQAASPERVKSLLASHPDYFDGTKVSASHILIPCPPLASTAKQKAAMETIRRIQTAIRAGQIEFSDAAKRYSTCPSKAKGGDLGEFEFFRMSPPFAQAAFDTQICEVTDVIRTEFGFHLIHVTGRTKGSGKPGPRAESIAKNLLLSKLQNRIFDQIMTTVPVVISEESREQNKPLLPPAEKSSASPAPQTAPSKE